MQRWASFIFFLLCYSSWKIKFIGALLPPYPAASKVFKYFRQEIRGEREQRGSCRAASLLPSVGVQRSVQTSLSSVPPCPPFPSTQVHLTIVWLLFWVNPPIFDLHIQNRLLSSGPPVSLRTCSALFDKVTPPLFSTWSVSALALKLNYETIFQVGINTKGWQAFNESLY